MFKPIDDIIAANAAHNRMVRLFAATKGAPLIDMTAGVDGLWDDDLYLDIVHFTEAGNERVAGVIFRQLLPILAERDGLRCVAAVSGMRSLRGEATKNQRLAACARVDVRARNDVR